MKKRLFAILAGLLILLSFTGCTKTNKANQPKASAPKITAAIFPVWDWTRNILGENPGGFELTLLLDKGVDLHSFQPSVDDILTITNCDLFIYVGGESDQWVTSALQQAEKQPRIIKLMDVPGAAAKEEETVEGMQAEEGESDEAEYDEHIWLSLRNAAAICDAIASELKEMDPENAAVYETNTASYKEKLARLDAAYTEAVSNAAHNTILFGDRFPFRYLIEDYGLNYYAAFAGCSAETEASFATITFLAQKVDELALPAVLTIDGSDGRIAETIVQSTVSKDSQVLTLDSMQSVSAQSIKEGTTYLSVMESNLETLKQALGSEAR